VPEAVLRRVAQALGVGYFNLMDWLGGFFKPTATKFKKVERFTAQLLGGRQATSQDQGPALVSTFRQSFWASSTSWLVLNRRRL